MDDFRFTSKVFVSSEKKVESSNKGNENSTLKTLLTDFSQNTGLHVANKTIIGHTFCIRRVIWSLLLLASISYVTAIVIGQFNEYYDYPTLVNTKITLSDELPFPAITICSLTSISKSKLGSLAQFENYWGRFSFFPPENTYINWSDPVYREHGFFEPLSLQTKINQSISLETFLNVCVFNAYPLSCSEEFVPIVTTLDVCFTANKDGHLRTKNRGAIYGLSASMFLNQNDSYWSLSSSTGGIKVIVHDPKEEPDVLLSGFYVPPGVQASVEISRKENEYLPYPFKAFTNGYCIDTEAADFVNPLKGRNYSLHSCLRQCYARLVYDKCGCVGLQDADMGLEFCSLYSSLTCYMKMLSIVLTNDTYRNQCSCQRPCRSLQFDEKLSFSQFPSVFLGKELVNRGIAASAQEYGQDHLGLQIYYEDLMTCHVRQEPVYASITDIFANLGGQLGLFLGASLLTLTELGELLLYLILHCAKKVIKAPVLKH